jgi:SAM-dependent methyltransferase
MRLSGDAPGPVLRELDLCTSLMRLAQADVVELGCGRAEFTRAAAERFPEARFVALDVDAVQHAKNVASPHPRNVRFGLGAAEAIPEPDASADAVLMLKSLHHVPAERMDAALDEIARVLRAGGHAYVTEPICAGEFDALMALFHDERDARKAAFDALRRAAVRGPLGLQGEHFWQARRAYASFDEFETRMIRVTHTRHRLSAARLAAVRERFARHADADGAAVFEQSMRTDVLVRTG